MADHRSSPGGDYRDDIMHPPCQGKGRKKGDYEQGVRTEVAKQVHIQMRKKEDEHRARTLQIERTRIYTEMAASLKPTELLRRVGFSAPSALKWQLFTVKNDGKVCSTV